MEPGAASICDWRPEHLTRPRPLTVSVRWVFVGSWLANPAYLPVKPINSPSPTVAPPPPHFTRYGHDNNSETSASNRERTTRLRKRQHLSGLNLMSFRQLRRCQLH